MRSFDHKRVFVNIPRQASERLKGFKSTYHLAQKAKNYVLCRRKIQNFRKISYFMIIWLVLHRWPNFQLLLTNRNTDDFSINGEISRPNRHQNIFRALSDDIHRIVSLSDPKNNFRIINQHCMFSHFVKTSRSKSGNNT